MENLTTKEEIVAHMRLSVSEEDWDRRCDEVKAANGGDYPSFWYATIILSGVCGEVVMNFSKK